MTSILPKSLQDDSNLAIEQTIAKTFNSNLTQLMLYAFDQVSNDLLPLLAEQFHILGDEGWSYATTEQEKRDLLRNAFIIHQYKGTKYSLIKVLDLLHINGYVQEWFEYEGNPYYFKVILNVTQNAVSDEKEQQLIKLINAYKNIRSRLESIEVRLTTNYQQKIHTCVKIGEIITVNALKTVTNYKQNLCAYTKIGEIITINKKEQ